MFTRMKLENFKSWQSLDIELAPLTLLFGTNSSGKSSILQAILLILQSFEKNEANINFGGGKYDYVNLGSFRDIVFQHLTDKSIRIYMLLDYVNLIQSLKLTGNSHLLTRFDTVVDVDIEIKYENDKVVMTSNSEEVFHNFSLIVSDLYGQNLINYLGPLRQYPQRSYLWSGASPQRIEPDGENTIAALIESTRKGEHLLREVGKWLIEMELVDAFGLTSLDREKRFYETTVEIRNTMNNLLDVGFGISQILPVITMLFFVPENSIVLLEQPELHLHPRAQAHLADLMLHVAEERKLQLIVESHSEHLLRRLQRRIAEQDHEFANPDNIKMYFCDMGENGSTIQPVEVDEYGQIQNWPDKFFGDITGDLEAMTMAALKRSLNGKN